LPVTKKEKFKIIKNQLSTLNITEAGLWRQDYGGKVTEASLRRQGYGGKVTEARLRRHGYGGTVTEAKVRRQRYGGKGTEARLWRQGYGGKGMEETLGSRRRYIEGEGALKEEYIEVSLSPVTFKAKKD